MGMIFPLSTGGRIALMLIAIVLGLIWSYFQWPDFWRKLLKKSDEPPVQQPTKQTSVKK